MSVYQTPEVTNLLSFGQVFYLENGNKNSPLVDLFFTEKNILFLKCEVEKSLERLIHMPVEVRITEEFGLSMREVMQYNLQFGYLPEMLMVMNTMFIEKETKIRYYSYREEQLQKKYFLTNARLKFMDYGQPTKITRGELTVCNSNYMLTNPWRKQNGRFLTQVLDMKCNPETLKYDSRCLYQMGNQEECIVNVPVHDAYKF